MFHIKHVELMAAIAYESVSIKILINFAVIPRCAVREYACIFKAFFDRPCTASAAIAPYDLTCCKINGAWKCIVNTANIQNQYAVNVNPKVIITIELID